MCYQALNKKLINETQVLDAISRGMNAYVALQLKQPQPAWALQYNAALLPEGARSFEPKSVATNTTVDNIGQLIKFYRLTGDRKFLARIPEALDWLETTKLPEQEIKNNRNHAGNIEVGTGRFLYTHRRGSNVVNGEYYADYNHEKTLAHYGSTRRIDIASLRAAYAEALALSPEQLAKNSPLTNTKKAALPKYFSFKQENNSDLNLRAQNAMSNPQKVQDLVATLNPQGYWPIPLLMTSNPYKGEPPKTDLSNDERYAETLVGDEWDTSPYIAEKPVLGISTGVYIKNMSTLIRYLSEQKQ